MKRSFLITGITGQVGSQLADFILENTDFDVIGMMRWQEPLNNISHLTKKINNKDRVHIFYSDLNDFSSIQRLIREWKPNYISHLAAQSFPKTSFNIPIETLQTNVIGTANLLENVRIAIEIDPSYSPIIHICSSSEVYGKAKEGILINEETSLHGASPYSISKIATDHLGQFYGEAYNIKTFVTRMGTHSGPKRSDVFFESTLAKQIALIESGFQEPILKLGNLSSIRTFQDTRDAVNAYYLLIRACEDGKIKFGDVFNISGKEVFNLKEVVNIFLELTTRDDIKISLDKERIRPIDANYQMFDNSKLKRTIDWEPKISARKMFKDLLNYWREQIKNGNIPLDR